MHGLELLLGLALLLLIVPIVSLVIGLTMRDRMRSLEARIGQLEFTLRVAGVEAPPTYAAPRADETPTPPIISAPVSPADIRATARRSSTADACTRAPTGARGLGPARGPAGG